MSCVADVGCDYPEVFDVNDYLEHVMGISYLQIRMITVGGLFACGPMRHTTRAQQNLTRVTVQNHWILAAMLTTCHLIRVTERHCL